MPYVEEALLPGERIVYRGRPHWAMLVSHGIAFALLCVLAVISDSGFVGALALFPAVTGSVAIGRYLSTEIAVTDRRILGKTGIFGRHASELALDKLETVIVEQPVLGRIFGYGRLVFVGSGGSRAEFPGIADPMGMRRHALGAKEG